MKKTMGFKWYSCVLAALLLVACESDDTNNSAAQQALVGVFQDSPVSGLGFSTASRSGVTNNNGEFTYLAGETLNFSIGSVVLGSAPGKPVITPLDLVSASSSQSPVDIDHPQVVNTLRLLQTLDADSYPDNGIKINSVVKDAAVGTGINLTNNQSVEEFESDPVLLQFINDATGKNQLVETDVAQQHFERTLGQISGNNLYTVGGIVIGLIGDLTLNNNGNDEINITSSGEFSFRDLLATGADYNISITAPQEGQICTIQNGAGVIAATDVISILVTCVDDSQNNPDQLFNGTTTGLVGTLILRTNNNTSLPINSDGSLTSFEFVLPVTGIDSFPIVIDTHPTNQTCGFVNQSTITLGTSQGVQIQCNFPEPVFSISGSVNGLASGSVTQDLVILNNGGDAKTITTNGSFTFSTTVVGSAGYNVTIQNQRTGQTCNVSNGSANTVTTNVTNVTINCVDNTFTIGGTVSGLVSGSVVQDLVLLNNGGDAKTITANGSYTFSATVSELAGYNVTIQNQRTGQTCSVSNGSASLVITNVTDVAINCADNTFTIGGTVSGLESGSVAQDLVLLNNGGDAKTITVNGSFTFATAVSELAGYNVTIQSQRTGQNCSVSSGSANTVTTNITGVVINCADNTFTISGTVSGLASGSVVQDLVLLNNGGDAKTITANGGFTFTIAISELAGYNVTILNQRTGQTCSVSNGSANTVTANVTDVVVNCADNTFTIGGTVSGLASGSVAQDLVLLNNGGDAKTIIANGSFTFVTAVSELAGYGVTIQNQRTGQTCTVSNGSVSLVTENVTDVAINCTDNSFTIGGTVSGLVSGSVAQDLVLLNNGSDAKTITASGSFTFATAVSELAGYNVTIQNQRTGQTCSVSSGSASPVTSNITDVVVNCSDTDYTIGGSVSGLSGTLVLQNNGDDDLTISANDNFIFLTRVAEGGGYNVTVLNQPLNQICSISNGSGTNVINNISDVVVTCENTFTIGGTVSGLANGTVAQDLVLLNHGGDAKTITANGGFTFSTSVIESAGYNVTIQNQRTGQTCSVNNGSASSVTANVTDVAINCADNTFTIGGTVSGLASGSVAQDLILLNNDGNAKTITTNGSFTFATAVSELVGYNVTIQNQRTGQTCAVSNGSVSPVTSNVTNVAINCADNIFTIGGTVNGLANGSVAQDLVLLNNGGDAETITANGSFSFATVVSELAGYDVTIQNQRTGQSCSVSSGSASSVTANVTDVVINCADNTFTIGGTMNGLASGSVAQDLILLNNGGDAKTITANGSFTFVTAVSELAGYNVTIQNQRTGQTCSVSNGSASPVTANVTNVAINCADNTFTIGGTVTGLASGSVAQDLVLLNNGGDAKTISVNGDFTFATSVSELVGYNVTIQNQRTGQICSVSNGSASPVTANITDVTINCTDNTFTIGGTVSGLASGSVTQDLVLLNNAGDAKTITANGSFIFNTAVSELAGYNVTIQDQRTGQNCIVSNGSAGTVTENVISVAISCVDKPLIADITYLECTGSLPNPAAPCVNGKFEACVNTYAASEGWIFVEEVTFLGCRNKGIDDPKDASQFPNLTGIELGGGDLSNPGNPLNQMDKSFFNLPGMEFINVAPNARFPQLSFRIQINGISSANVADFIDAITVREDGFGDITGILDIYEDSVIGSGSKSIVVEGKMWGYYLNVRIPENVGNQICSFGNNNSSASNGDTSDRLNGGDRILENEPTSLQVVNCADVVTIGGRSSGYAGSLVIQNNGTDDLSIIADTLFEFVTPVLDYNVTLISEPLDQDCSVLNSSGSEAENDVTDVSVNCWSENTFTFASSLNAGRFLHSSTVLNDKIYVVGGSQTFTDTLSSVERYDISTDTWSTVAPLTNVRKNHSSAVLNGLLYAFGGKDGSTTLASAEVYDPALDSWTTFGAMQIGRSEHSSAVLDGKIYAIGGDDGSNSLTSVEFFDPVTFELGFVSPLPDRRSQHSSVVLNGLIYVIGGNSNKFGATQSVIVYDPINDSWSYIASLNTARRFHSSVVLDGKIYAIGGNDNNFDLISSVEVYDPVADAWVVIGNTLYHSISYHTSEVIDGEIYTMGGYDPNGSIFINRTDVLVYDLLSDKFNPFGAQSSFTATPNEPIPDADPGNPVVSSINVIETGVTITDSLIIDVEIQHTYQGDLILQLQSPSGSSVTLWNRAGSSTDDIIGSFSATPASATLTSSESLSGLNGDPMDGTWILTVSDNAGEDVGTLISWGIHP